MKIAIRADASTQIGSGHIMRMLTLANALKKKGHIVSFFTCDLQGNLNHLIHPSFHLIQLKDSTPEMLVSSLKQSSYDWLIIDHYKITVLDERYIKDKIHLPILSMDDNFLPHHSDIILNQNIYATPSSYQDLAPKETKVLSGLKFALIREEFQVQSNLKKVQNSPLKLLITLGGSDPDNLIQHILSALINVSLVYEVTVVCGPANQNYETLKSFSSAFKHIHIIKKTSSMARLMHEHDCAITAAGSSTIESLLMKLPSIVIPIANNQVEVANTLKSRALAIKVLWTLESNTNHMSQTIQQFLQEGYKKLKLNLQKLHLTADGADLVANELINYKEYHAR